MEIDIDMPSCKGLPVGKDEGTCHSFVNVQSVKTGGLGSVKMKEPSLKEIDEPTVALRIIVIICFYSFLLGLCFLFCSTLSFVTELFPFPVSPFEPCHSYTGMAQPPVTGSVMGDDVLESGHDPPVIGSVDEVIESGHDPPVIDSEDNVIERGHDPPVIDSGM